MGSIVLKPTTKVVEQDGKKVTIKLVYNAEFDKFNPQVLGLGDISSPSTKVEAIASVFDLSGFTNFCNQVDPQLSVPEYLSRFLDWLFDQIKNQVVVNSYPEGKQLYSNLPFLAKFLGDGVLFLWNTVTMNETEICNVVAIHKIMCDRYMDGFYPQIKKVVVEPPKILRCGIARGTVFSVGNGEDYVGPCINIAARLQKLRLLTFCFSRRGFDIEKAMAKSMVANFVLKSVSIQGIGENELVWVLKKEFDGLPNIEKQLFKSP